MYVFVMWRRCTDIYPQSVSGIGKINSDCRVSPWVELREAAYLACTS